MAIVIDPAVLRAIDPGHIDVGLSPVRIFDVECWVNFFCVGVWTVDEGFRAFSTEPGVGEPLAAFVEFAAEPALWCGYNNLSYDNWMVALALTGETEPAAFKNVNDRIIGGDHRERCRRFSDNGECIDLFAMLKGIYGRAGSLKWCALKLGYPISRESPFGFDATLERNEMVQVVVDYNLHDVAATAWCLRALQEAVTARIWLEDTYTIDALNVADSGLAEQILMKSLFNAQGKYALPRHAWPRQTEWTVDVAPLVDRFEFVSPEMTEAQAVMREWMLHYRVEQKDDGERKVNRVRQRHEFEFEGITLRLGLGGLHSLDKPCSFEADDEWTILDFDFAGFYPTIIDSYGLRPSHLPAAFNDVFRDLIDQRDQAVQDGNAVAGLAYKVANNSIFGKSKSAHSFLCDPSMTAAVCILGQMIVLQAIELVAGIGNDPHSAQTVMANTDGITVKCRRHLADTVRETMHAVADAYDLKVKETEYVRLIRRDGNNYLSLDVAGKIKTKGAFNYDAGNPEKFAAERVVVDAVRAYFLHDLALADTINAADDVALFVNGFACSKGWHLTDSTGTADYGRFARWVHVVGGTDLYKAKASSGKPQRCTGTNGGSAVSVRLLADLPTTVPMDLDRAVYLERAERLVRSVTNPETGRWDLLKLSELTAEQSALFQRNAGIETPDLVRCGALYLGPYAERYAEKRQGDSYHTMLSVLFWLWVSQPGQLTLGDLHWCGEQISQAVDDYFSGDRAERLTAMVEHYACEVPPFARPRCPAECVEQAWGQTERSVAEGKIKLAKTKKKLYHNSFPEDSAFLGNKQIITKYTRTRNLFPIALSLCSTCIKHGRPRDDAFLIGILEEVVAYYD